MDVVSLRASFIVVLLSLHVHQIEFVHEAVTFEQVESAVHRDAVNLWVESAGPAQQLRRIKMLLGYLNHAENSTALTRHA